MTHADFEHSAVTDEARCGFLPMLAVMLGFTFFSASMVVGVKMAQHPQRAHPAVRRDHPLAPLPVPGRTDPHRLPLGVDYRLGNRFVRGALPVRPGGRWGRLDVI